MMEEEPDKIDPQNMQLDALADFHQRLSKCESFDISLSRRITALEDAARGRGSDDPLAGMTPMLCIMVLLTFAPVVVDLVRQWRAPAGA